MHTKEPWKIAGSWAHPFITTDRPEKDDVEIGFITYRTDAERIVKLHNACAGLSEDDLKLIPEVKAMYKALKELCLLCKGMPDTHCFGCGTWNIIKRIEGGE